MDGWAQQRPPLRGAAGPGFYTGDRTMIKKKDKLVKKLKSPIKAASVISVHDELQRVTEEIDYNTILIRAAEHRLEPKWLEKQIEVQRRIIDAAEKEVAKLQRWYDEAPSDIDDCRKKIKRLKTRQAQLRNARKIDELVRLAKESVVIRKELKEKGLKLEQ